MFLCGCGWNCCGGNCGAGERWGAAGASDLTKVVLAGKLVGLESASASGAGATGAGLGAGRGAGLCGASCGCC